jgi:hypothetical protein
MLDIISIACLTGVFGDALLQIGAKSVNRNWSLKPYFAQHGSAESLFIASGMSIFYVFYLYVLRLPLNYVYLAIYGIIVDLIFRKFMIFKSLEPYYKSLNYFWSAFWMAIPMMLPFFIYNILLNYLNT